MDFISNQAQQVQSMLEEIGAANIDELFSVIPHKLRLARQEEDDGLSELEGMRLMEEIASKNSFTNFESYLGAGAYQHYVPAFTGAICAKSEFLTSYTPYQSEASQGMLQIIFEFQSAICALTGMDVANASLYDAACACAEALLMALRLSNRRNKVAVAKTLHPHYLAVVEQYLSSHAIQIDSIPYGPDGCLDAAALRSFVDGGTAAIILQSPNFFGVIEDVAKVASQVKLHGALTILCANPLSYGLYANAGELGADIAVGDVQPFGLPLQFGGPYVGYLACRQEFVRQMPGRLVGETVDASNRRGFVLTLQAREQHIRREKATSNICTNQALAALASLTSMLWYGKEGIRKLALTNYQRAAYLKDNLSKLTGVRFMADAPFFNEFAVNFGCPVDKALQHFRLHGVEPGVDLGRFYPELDGYLLVAVTEVKSKAMLGRYLDAAEKLCP